MTKDEITKLCRLIPVGATRFSIPVSGDTSAAQRWLDVEYTALHDPSFGFNFIRTLVDTGTPFPLRAKFVGQSLLELAYSYERMAAEGNRPTNGAISAAHYLAYPGNRLAAVVNACLLQPSKECSYARIAKMVGVSEMTIKFYETLYFNVRDREDDAGYLFSLIWPHGRYMSYDPVYARMVPEGQLLLQTCDEFGLEKGLAGYGFTRNYPGKLDASQSMIEIKHAMTTKCIAAFWAGQSGTSSRDIGRHMAFQIAEAQSGGAQSGALENVGMTCFGELLLEDIRRIGELSAAEPTIDVTAEAVKQMAEKT